MSQDDSSTETASADSADGAGGQDEQVGQWLLQALDDAAGKAAGAAGGARTADDPFTQAVDWWSLSAEERLTELGELRIFVARLMVAYELDSTFIPPCWEKHEGYIRFLDALHRSYLDATHPAQTGEALMGWHHNYQFVRDELAACSKQLSCTSLTHHPFQAPAWATAIVNDGKDGHEWQARQEEVMVAYRGQAVAAAVESGV